MRVNDQLANSVSSSIDRLLNDRSSLNQNDILQGNNSGQKAQVPQDLCLLGLQTYGGQGQGQGQNVYEVV
jgi:uncharacterized protein YpbB